MWQPPPCARTGPRARQSCDWRGQRSRHHSHHGDPHVRGEFFRGWRPTNRSRRPVVWIGVPVWHLAGFVLSRSPTLAAAASRPAGSQVLPPGTADRRSSRRQTAWHALPPHHPPRRGPASHDTPRTNYHLLTTAQCRFRLSDTNWSAWKKKRYGDGTRDESRYSVPLCALRIICRSNRTD
jgi:hypothetical protein